MLEYLEKLISELKSGDRCDKKSRVFELLNDKDTNPTRMIMIGSELYRARKIEGSEPIDISKGFYGYDARGSFVNPNTENITAMRANRDGQPRLYCSNVIYLPLVEVKPEIGKKISLACIQTNEILNLLDLTLYHLEFDMPQEKQDLFRELSQLFATPIDDDNDDKKEYIITQEIADYVEQLGYDGIAYSSSLVPELNKENYNGANFVIFKYDHCIPTKSNVVKMVYKPNLDKYDFDHCEFQQTDKDETRLILITSENGKYNFHFPFGDNPDPNVHYPNGANPNIFVSVGRIMFNTPVKIVIKNNVINVYVGSILKIIIKENEPAEKQLTMPDNLNSRLNDLTLILQCIEEGKIWFGDANNPQVGNFSMEIPLEQYGKHIDWYKKQFDIATEIKIALLSVNQYFNIDMDHATDMDRQHVDLLVNYLYKGKTKNSRLPLAQFQVVDIQGHRVYLIFDKVREHTYRVLDGFRNIFKLSGSVNSSIPVIISQFSTITPEILISAGDVKFDVFISSYGNLYNSVSNYHLPLIANQDLWTAIKAYDITKDSKYLHLAEDINKWIQSVSYPCINEGHHSFINQCQINKRKGILSKEEVDKLKYILQQKNIEKTIIPMIYILLDNPEMAKKEYDNLDDRSKEWFSNLPIVNLCPQII